MASVQFYDDITDTFGAHTTKYQWMGLNKYTKIYISHVGYGGLVRGIQPKDYPACRQWMLLNLAGEIIIKIGDRDDYTSFYFLLESDLMLFKLSHWGTSALQWQPDR